MLSSPAGETFLRGGQYQSDDVDMARELHNFELDHFGAHDEAPDVAGILADLSPPERQQNRFDVLQHLRPSSHLLL